MPAPPPVVFDDPDMADEIGPVEPETKPFDKDLSERIKVLLQVMQFVSKLESDEQGADNTAKPILEVFARRGVGAARIDFIANELPGDLGRNVNGTGRPESGIRTVSGELPEGPLDVPDSEQGEAVGVFDAGGTGSDTQGGDES